MTDAGKLPPGDSQPATEVATVHQTGVSLLSLESQNFWQITAQYLLALTVLAGFLSFSEGSVLFKCLASALGIWISILWRGSAKRSNSWHDFRVRQCRKIEEAMPEDMRLVTQADLAGDKIEGPSIRKTVEKLSWGFTLFFAILLVVEISGFLKLICPHAA